MKNPAPETHLKTLTIWDNSVMDLTSLSGEFKHDGTKPAHLSGLSHLYGFTLTRSFTLIYMDFLNTMA